MNRYFIESFKITKLWGYLDINLIFNNDVNILIGPNASGKTTILNLLHSILSADLPSLSNINFDRAEIKLRSFSGKSVRTIKASFEDGFLKLGVGRSKYVIDIDPRTIRKFTQRSLFPQRIGRSGRRLPGALHSELTDLVPIVWLPVSRRLPVTEDEEEQHTRTGSVESVDLRLDELLDELSDYHSGLNAQLYKRYKEFEHQVLSVMLYNKEHDQPNLIPSSSPTKADKEQLLGAFEAAGLLNKAMQTRIDEHFAAAEEVSKRFQETDGWDIEDILVLPLIGRTKAMVEYAGQLEKDRERIFEPLRLYEETVNSFLNEKSVEVDEGGRLKIESASPSELTPRSFLRVKSRF